MMPSRRDVNDCQTVPNCRNFFSRLIPVIAVSVALTAGGVWLAATAADGPPQPDKVAAFMRAKLAHSQDVLEGLTTEDFELIEKGAQELALASLDSNWQVLQTEDYVRQSAEFRRACGSLRDAAKAKNLDGATLAWMDVTLKCVQCHKYVRDEK
jgi:cytochrome c556